MVILELGSLQIFGSKLVIEGTPDFGMRSGAEISLSKFPRLFHLSDNKEGCVCEMGRWLNGEWKWELRWRMLLEIKMQEGREDRWRWGERSDQEYSVKEAYLFISKTRSAADRRMMSCARVWNSFKQQVAAWRFLKDRIPISENLHRRMPMSPAFAPAPRNFQNQPNTFCSIATKWSAYGGE